MRSALAVSSMILLLAFMPLAYAAFNDPCTEDGTAYGACSTKNPGYRCWYSSSTGRNTLQLWLVDAQNKPVCPCSAVAGYKESNGACVKSTCVVSGNTVAEGACLNNLKCSNGDMKEDPATCGCPTGKKAQNGVCVDNKDGCRWPNSLKCLNYQECKFDAASATDSGSCQTMSGCQLPQSQYNNQACNQDTETCNQQTGKCEKKAGTCTSNTDCGTGKTCNVLTHACESSSTSTGDSAPLLGGNAAAASTPTDSTSKPTLCCLPIGLGATGVGLAFASRRRR
jgi:hypothetical protein